MIYLDAILVLLKFPKTIISNKKLSDYAILFLKRQLDKDPNPICLRKVII